VESYRTAMRGFAGRPILDVWYAHIDIEDDIAGYTSALSLRELRKEKADSDAREELLAKAHTRDSLHAVAKLTTSIDGRRRIISEPPLVVPLEELTGLDPD